MKKLFAVKMLALGLAGLTLASCGGAKQVEVKRTGTYLSNDKIAYQNFLPTYNYYTLTSSTQRIETYDNNTYVFTKFETLYSNVSFGPDVAAGSETWNDQRMMITTFTGTFTQESDEDSLTLTLAVPTAVSYTRTGLMTIDTSNWIDEMAEAAVDYQGNVLKDDDGNAYTASSYLAYMTKEFEESSVLINKSTYKFSQIAW